MNNFPKHQLELLVLAEAYHAGEEGSLQLRRIPADYFDNPRHRRIAERIINGEPLGAEVLLLRDVQSQLQVGHLHQHINELLLEGYLDKLHQHATNLQQACHQRDRERANNLVTSFPTEPFDTGEEYTISLLLDSLANEPPYTIDLGPKLSGLQSMWGPLMPGGVYVIAAPEGVGKSALAEQIALVAAKQGHGVVDYTLEMAGQVRALRYMQHLYGASVGPKAYFQRSLDKDLYAIARQEVETLPLYIVSGVDDVHRTISSAERFVNQYNVRLFIVDFVQSLGGDSSQDQYTIITNAMKSIFRFARDTNTVWLVLSQMNRDGLKRVLHNDNGEPIPPDNTALEGSSKIPQYAWTVTFLVPVSSYARRAFITKNRISGLLGRLDMGYDGDRLEFNAP